MASKTTVKYICSINCPNCKENIDVLKEVHVITPAEKAVKEEKYYASKNTQTTLLGEEKEAP